MLILTVMVEYATEADKISEASLNSGTFWLRAEYAFARDNEPSRPDKFFARGESFVAVSNKLCLFPVKIFFA